MGAVDAQLVGAPRCGVEFYAAVAFINIVCDGRFSVIVVDRLAWGVEGVAADGQSDDALGGLLGREWGLENGDVFFFHVVLHKLLLQLLAAGQGFGSQKESGGVLIQAVDETNLWIDGGEVGLERHFAVIFAGDREQPRWFIDYHEVVVLENDAYLGQECFCAG